MNIFKKSAKVLAVAAVLALTVLNLRVSLGQEETSTEFSLSQISLFAEAAQAECANQSSGNDGHCRSDGGTGSCVDSYWFESNNCKR